MGRQAEEGKEDAEVTAGRRPKRAPIARSTRVGFWLSTLLASLLASGLLYELIDALTDD
jgi:hypothetical protein